MIRVLHLITGLNLGGAENMLCQVVQSSNTNKLKHIVVSMMDDGVLGDEIRAHRIPVYTLGMRRGSPSLRGLVNFLKLVHQHNPDILQTWLYHADLLGLLARPFVKAKLVWNIRCSQHPGANTFTVKICAKLSNVPAAIIINSEAGRAAHRSLGYRSRRWAHIPNGVDLGRFKPDSGARESLREELGIANDIILIGLIARFNPLKDHTTFLRAAEHLVKIRPHQVTFLLVGQDITWSNAVLSDSITRYGLKEHVRLLGRRLDVSRIMGGLDILSCSSSSEGFPNVVAEAMACAVPCVVTNVGDAAQIVGPAGYVVPPGDAVGMADGWIRMIELGAVGRQALGSTARGRIESHYSLEAAVGQYEKLYSSLINPESAMEKPTEDKSIHDEF